MILTSETYLDVVMNFMALAVISEFDDAFYGALGEDPIKDILTNAAYDDLYTITRTSSSGAAENEDNILEDDTVPENLKEQFRYIGVKYEGAEKVLRFVYKVFRILQTTVWFYFLPFVALLGSYLVPYIIRENAKANGSSNDGSVT